MGTCYSKAGNEASSSNLKNRPKDRKKSSYKNGKLRDNPKLTVEDCDMVQTDVSDTVYTEDSHTFNTLDVHCINRSQQTSLDMLGFKNTDRESNSEATKETDSHKISVKTGNMQEPELNGLQKCDTGREAEVSDEFVNIDLAKHENLVVTSDSGIEMEHTDVTAGCEKLNTLIRNHIDSYSTEFESNIAIPVESLAQNGGSVGDPTEDAKCKNLEGHSHNPCSCPNSDSLKGQLCSSGKDHSGQSCIQDLEKIKLAIGRSSIVSTSEQRSFDGGDSDYELPTVMQPEITRTTMNGRDVIVVDAELFSQIIDEIQILKMKLTHLTHVIQDSEDGEPDFTDSETLLSSST